MAYTFTHTLVKSVVNGETFWTPTMIKEQTVQNESVQNVPATVNGVEILDLPALNFERESKFETTAAAVDNTQVRMFVNDEADDYMSRLPVMKF